MENKIIVASGPVIIENGRVLLNKHGDDGFWKFPGGRAGFFEFKNNFDSLEEICCKKVYEEMGINIAIKKPLKPMMLPKSDDFETWIILVHYLADRKGKIVPGEEIKKWDWFDIDNLPNDCAPNIKPVIEDYLKSEA